MRHIKIFDSTLRDAEQIPGARLNADQKLEVARQLARLNVDCIEAGFPASSPGDSRSVALIAEKVQGPIITGLARCVKVDIDAAWEAVRIAAKPRIHVFLGMSDVHIEQIIRKTRKEALAMAIASIRYAREKCADIEFSPMDATRMEFDFLCETVEKCIEAGATTINIPDTVGYAVPAVFGEVISGLLEKARGAKNATISVHCHNDLGLATANSLAAVKAGASQVECCMNGLGERAGNAALEEVVMTIRTRKDYFNADTQIEAKEIVRTSRMVSTLMGIAVQPNKAIVGANAFAHSSGIHQDGIIKNRSTFEVISPDTIGLDQHHFVLTARSGRNALRHRLSELGYQVENIDAVYERFIQLADRKKEVTNADLEALVGAKLRETEEKYHLESMEALSTTTKVPCAKVRLSVGGKIKEAEATGDGPVDALFKAIEKCVGRQMSLVDYSVRAVTGGKEALGEVTVRVISGKITVNASANATDIVEASARAFVNAANLLVVEEK